MEFTKKDLMEKLDMSEIKAKKIMLALNEDIDLECFEVARKMVWHDMTDVKLEIINSIMNASGIESITCENAHIDNYYYSTIALFINVVDPYIDTIIYDTSENEFELTSYGNWLEHWEYEGKGQEIVTEYYESEIDHNYINDFWEYVSGLCEYPSPFNLRYEIIEDFKDYIIREQIKEILPEFLVDDYIDFWLENDDIDYNGVSEWDDKDYFSTYLDDFKKHNKEYARICYYGVDYSRQLTLDFQGGNV